MFGIWNDVDAAQLTFYALHSMQHRGQEGAGIVSGDATALNGYRNVGLLADVFKDSDKLTKLKGTCALGGVWYSSQDTNNVQNIEPLLFKFHDEHIAITMSGDLLNAMSLRRCLEEEGAVFHSSSNAELIVHLIRRSRKESFEERLKEALLQLEGAFSVMILTCDGLYGAVDKHAFRPLVLGKLDNTYMLASETCAFNVLAADFIMDISAGELVKITDDGYTKEYFTTPQDITVEAMEFIYFARPDSTILGKNVYTVRKESGKILAKESPVDADIVIGVPNSSLSLASGYAEGIGLPFETGLLKNQYMGRTFIQPTQKIRELGVKMKLSALKEVVDGKRVILLDDSIVRGTTSRRIVNLLRQAGATQVHVRIGSPLIVFPNFSGIDMKRSKDLIGANKTKDEICEEICADSLEYLSIEGLKKAVGFPFDTKNQGLSLDLFDATYIDGLGDNAEIFIQELTPIQKQYLKGDNYE